MLNIIFNKGEQIWKTISSRVALVIFSLLLGSCSKFTRLQKSDNLDKKYKAALEYYADKQYYKAGTLFEELIPILRGQAESEKAQFYYAYCQYWQGQLVLSAYYFRKFTETYPRSEFVEEAFYMHCQSLFDDSPYYELDQTNTYKALESLQEMFERFPNTRYKDQCNQMIDELNEKIEMKMYQQAKQFYHRRDYRASVICFDNFIKDFPSSKYLEEMAFLKLESQYLYATMSVEEKKKERLLLAQDFYFDFIEKYPNSKRIRNAENILEKIQDKLLKL